MENDFSSLPIKHTYDSGLDDVLWDFYIPVLGKANRYDRIAGFFSSTSLSLAARGLSEFIVNGGEMHLVTCPKLSSDDARMLELGQRGFDEIVSDNFVRDYSEIETSFQRDHVKAMGWMIGKHKLEIRIAVIKKNGHVLNGDEIERSGIMHQKVGVLYDRCGNVITFSGSNNESMSGWLGNTEEFKVFRSWDSGYPYYKDDIGRFESFWEGNRPDVKIYSVPQAVKEKLIQISDDFEPEMLDVRKYYPKRYAGSKKEPLKLFFYQTEAVQKWDENHRQLLLEMATGCGKTRTAIGCMNKAVHDTSKLLVVISTPQSTLSAQWRKDVESLDVPSEYSIEINGTVPDWLTKLQKELLKLKVGQYQYLIVYITHDLCSSEKFIRAVNSTGSRVRKFLIGDEVHGLGAPEMQKALLDCYQYRLGLSATPQRWFDDAGSKLIANYFGGDSFKFDIHDALTEYNPLTMKHFLVNYEYHPVFVNMTDNELERYQELTLKLAKQARYLNDDDSYLQMVRFQRADIEKNAEEKYKALADILDVVGNDLTDTIIFVSPEQIDRVMKLLGKRGITASKYTEAQGTIPSQKFGGITEREYILDLFKHKRLQVLVAIKCLDEGIDIPSASRAILMASSTNPREYVQRIGRVIRQNPKSDKKKADIYDMIIRPDVKAFRDPKFENAEKRIFSKEMDRGIDIAKNAINNATAYGEMFRVRREVLS